MKRDSDHIEKKQKNVMNITGMVWNMDDSKDNLCIKMPDGYIKVTYEDGTSQGVSELFFKQSKLKDVLEAIGVVFDKLEVVENK